MNEAERIQKWRDEVTADFKAGKLIIENGWLVEVVDRHTCGTGPDGYYGAHEPGCGMIPVADLARQFIFLPLDPKPYYVEEADENSEGPESGAGRYSREAYVADSEQGEYGGTMYNLARFMPRAGYEQREEDYR